MTNDEAIYVLKNTAWLGWDKQKEKVTEAVRMAIEALKTQLPKEDITSDCISRQEAIRIASGYCHPANIAKELAKLPSAQPVDKDINVFCKDAISRQAAIDIVSGYAEQLNGYIGSPNDSEVYAYARGLILSIERNINAVRSVQPTYTDEQIQRIQDMEQAQLDKAFELGREDAKPIVEPERKKDIIQKFHDYQIDWLKSHYDIELEPQLEEMIVRFLHDTANCYIMEEGGHE